MIEQLSGDARKTALSALQARGWALLEERDAIRKTFQFEDFNQAFGVMTRVALYAEKVCHHPEWFNVWRTLEVTLTTHDAGGLSALDVDVARFIDAVADGAQ